MNSEWQSMLIEDLNAQLIQRAELIGQYEELEELLHYHKTNSSFEYAFATKIEILDREIQINLTKDIKPLIKEREQLYIELQQRISEQTTLVLENYMSNWISDFRGFRMIHGEEKYKQLLQEQEKQIESMIYTQYNKKIQGIIQIQKQFHQIDKSIQQNIQYVDKDLTVQLQKLQNKTNQSTYISKKDDTLQLSQIMQQLDPSKISSFQQDDSLLQHIDEFNSIMTKSSHPIKLQTIYEEQQNQPIRQHHHSKTVFSYKNSTAHTSPQASRYNFVKDSKRSLTKGTLLLKKFSNKPSKREYDIFQNQNPTQFGYGLRMAQLMNDRIEFRNQLKPQLVDSSLPLSQILRVIIPKQISGFLKKKPQTKQEKENNTPTLTYWPLQILTLNQGQVDLLFHTQEQLLEWHNGLMNVVAKNPNHPHIHHLESSPITTEIFYAGIVCIAFAIILLWFNERKAAINSFRLQYAREHCMTLTPYQEPLNQELIHINGLLQTDELVSDTDFGVSQINCVKLIRKVEMYQWIKGNNQQELKWVDHYVENNFGYMNDKTKWIIDQETFINSIVKLQQFELPEEMKKQIDTPSETVKLNQANVQIAQSKYKDKGYSKFTLKDDYIYFNQVDDQLVNGDLRIMFKQIVCSEVTIIAKSIQNNLLTWNFNDVFNQTVQKDYQDEERTCCWMQLSEERKPIKEIFWIFSGLLTAEECFSKVVQENQLISWIVRGIGYFLNTIGAILLLYPGQILTEYIPMNAFAGFKFFVIGIIFGIPLSIFTLSLAWLFYRPKIGILMLLLSFSLIGGIYYYAYQHK